MKPFTSFSFLAGLALAISASEAMAQAITRGPYLQMLSQDAITVRWQTDVATDSRVSYGSRPTTLTSVAKDAASVTEHELRLTGLAPNTTYYYSVGTSTTVQAGGDATCKFKTAPAPGTVQPVRFWVLGDSGTGGSGKSKAKAEEVRDGYFNSPLYQDPDFWIMLGDNAYDKGAEDETTRAIFQTYPTMLRKSALWSTCGNHEMMTLKGSPYYNAFSLPKNAECGGTVSGTEEYYSFDYANIHFVCLNSEGPSRAANGPMLTWLKQDLSNTRQKWIIAFWHAPPYTKGSHDSDRDTNIIDMRTNVLPVLEGNGVDLIMSGHSHSYERSMLIDGHYGLSATFTPEMAKNSGDGKENGNGVYKKSSGANKGAVYVVGGNSGKVNAAPLNHPAMKFSQSKLGSIIIDVNGNRLDLREIGVDGAVFDNFTLVKQ